MYPLYAISFIFTIYLLSFSIASDEKILEEVRSDVVAAQMYQYHTAAAQHCIENTCSNGLLNNSAVLDNLSDVQQSAVAYTTNRYSTYYSASSNLIVTVYNPQVQNYSKIGSALSADLIEITGNRRVAGAYNPSERRLDSDDNAVAIDIPNNIGSFVIPANSSILVRKF